MNHDEIRAALAAATPGPWVGAVPADDETDTAGEYLRNTLHDPDAHASHVHTVWTPSESERLGGTLIIAYTGDGPTSYANRELIANAPTWLAELLAEVDQLTARAEAAEQAVQRVRDLAAHWEWFGSLWSTAARRILRALDGGES